jgi:Rps23 Pro-64 3,4-dihydroxylase Tpa1-like proline 4-hydroxylase
MITVPAGIIDFSHFEVFYYPFVYAVSPRVFNSKLSSDILSWLETEAPWRLVETGFYEQYEFNFVDAEPPEHLAFLRNTVFLESLKSEVQKLLGINLGNRIDATAHKLVAGQRIRIHNDYIPGAETHRLLIQLNRGWEDKDGGLLIIFNSPDPADIHKILRPAHDSAVVFAISSKSHHAVTRIYGAERFTLVYSFYAEK